MLILPKLTLLNKLFNYNPLAGIITRKITVRGGHSAGDVAGYKKPKGYIIIRIGEFSYYAHRIAWKMFTGDDPCDNQLDHKNRVKDDNRIENLRLSNNSLNQVNAGMGRNNTTGYKGVSKHRNKWRVNIAEDYIGSFHNIKDAARAYNAEAIKRYGEYAWLNEI